MAICVACTENNIDEPSQDNSTTRRIYATITPFEEGGTRIELNDKLQTTWTAGDRIATFYNGISQLWGFEGNTGDRSGSFAHITDVNPASELIEFDRYYALIYHAHMYYPGYYNDYSPAFRITMPEVQSYKMGSYSLNSNIMLGSSDDGVNYSFKNVFAYLSLSLTGSKSVKSITLRGHNGEYLTGLVIVNTNCQITDFKEYNTELTLDCGDGVQLTDEPTNFYIVLPPTTFSNGFTVNTIFTDGTVYPKSTSKSVTLERNTIQPMATIDSDSDVNWQTITIKHRGTTIAAPHLTGETALTGYIYWGDGYMSDLYATESYVYSDQLSSHTITIKALCADEFSMDSCEGIVSIDLSTF